MYLYIIVHPGDCPNMAGFVVAALNRVSGTQVLLEEGNGSLLSSGVLGGGMPVEVEVDGVKLTGFREILSWIDEWHRQRVIDKLKQ